MTGQPHGMTTSRGGSATRGQPLPVPPETLAERVRLRRGKRPLALLLDYDGTLAPHVDRPEHAVPSAELLGLLAGLAGMPGVVVAVISGRDRESLDGWLGHLPVRLVAEHGYWVRGSAPGSWAPTLTAEVAFRGPARAVMDEATAHAPGSFVEEKSAGVAWHWRLAEPVRGGAIAGELARRLRERVGGQPVDVLEGDKVVEVRLAGANKGAAVERLRREVAAGSLFVCAGNDRTDEDMFRAAPRGSVTIRVGGGESRARFRLAAPPELHAFLLLLAPAG